MKFTRATRALLAVSSGAALALSFPDYNLWPLAWFSVGMLVLASVGAHGGGSPLYGFLHGLVFYPVCVPWIDTVMRQYGNLDPWTSAGILGLMAVAGGLLCSLFSWGIARASRKSTVLACALAPFLWVTLEYIRTHLPYIGFPWNLTGYAAIKSLALLQVTTITGIYGLSFLIAAYGSLMAFAFLARTQRAWRLVIANTAAVILIAVGGNYLVPKETPRFTAHLVQTNFPQSEHYPADWLQTHAGELDELTGISITAAKKNPVGPELIVWPEVPAPFSLNDPAFAARAIGIAREAHTDFLVGVVDWKQDAQRNWIASNSAVLLDPLGRRIFTYDKIHLVPFGEYVPLRRWLGFTGKLTADIGDFTPGTQYAVGQIPGGTFAAYICYEGVFPEVARRFTRGGAQLLINMSKDGGFGRSAAPGAHPMVARVPG